MAKKQQAGRISIQNRKATFEYAITDKYTAGIQLTGTEIKSIRDGNATISEAYCFMHEGEVFIKGMRIAEYKNGSYNNHEPLRDRKLLLHKQEIRKIAKKIEEKGFTIVPIKVFMSESGYAKLEIGIGKGKKEYDKREDIKKRDVQREIDRQF